MDRTRITPSLSHCSFRPSGPAEQTTSIRSTMLSGSVTLRAHDPVSTRSKAQSAPQGRRDRVLLPVGLAHGGHPFGVPAWKCGGRKIPPLATPPHHPGVMGNTEGQITQWADNARHTASEWLTTVGRATGFSACKVWHINLDGRPHVITVRHELSGERVVLINGARPRGCAGTGGTRRQPLARRQAGPPRRRRQNPPDQVAE